MKRRILSFTAVLVMVSVLMLALPAATAPSNTPRATSQTASSGSMTVIYGNPYSANPWAQGTGSQSLTLRGDVEPRTDLPGYYTYNTIRLSGSAHAEWTDGQHQFILDASFTMQSDQPMKMPSTTVPLANAFIITDMMYMGTLTVDGQARQATGMAQMVAAAPGLFGFTGQSRATTILIYYSQSLGYQFVLRWSEAPQTIFGIPGPAASQFSQTVELTGPNRLL